MTESNQRSRGRINSLALLISPLFSSISNSILPRTPLSSQFSWFPFDSWIPIRNFLYIFFEKFYDFLFGDWFEDIGPTAWEESIDHSKARILGRSSYKSDDPFFDPRQEDILLRFRPSMDLIEEEDCLSSGFEIGLWFCDNLDDIIFLREYCWEMEKLSI